MSDLQPPSLTMDLQEQSCTRKETTSLRRNTTMPNNDKKSNKQNKDLSKRNSDSNSKISMKMEMRDKKFRNSRDVTVILSDSIIKGCERSGGYRRNKQGCCKIFP